ncbi:hypothetical protein CHLRE_08g358500v5 [Chlamydomonas reinhardtii]|uniref:Uncharacterized protein n=1 Tax=Chlamydomonas reinhardtii TaxID=3055 RepID=A8JGD8_CHLRE|nr:uncharacterized protein CHLRE_08g358500v5 [Chlamydomonas reinhardtii]PNW79574.1 hypothetical protein CHLRE_08g358500v5 [Chlamydomonas reinhardtii]|eukprot:XP_001702292.1 hypothetical protein CHLREDRAFT_194753 [Chlamydomonas reinhardtii]
MHKCNCVYSAGAAPTHLPGKQVRLRTAVRAGALYTRPARHHRSVLERKLNKVLTNQGKMQKDIGEMQKDISQLKQDMAVNKALVAVNLTPVASLVLGVLYIMYTNFKVSGGG